MEIRSLIHPHSGSEVEMLQLNQNGTLLNNFSVHYFILKQINLGHNNHMSSPILYLELILSDKLQAEELTDNEY